MKLLKAIGAALFVISICVGFSWFFAGVYWVALHVDSDPRDAIFAPYIAVAFLGIVGCAYSSMNDDKKSDKKEGSGE